MGSFSDWCAETLERVGDGKLIGRVEVNQLYAHNQHDHLEYKHPRGGQALYLYQPLMEHHGAWLRELADAVLHGDLAETMAHCMEALSNDVYLLAPVEWNDLKNSGHPTVEDGEHNVVYDRPPNVARLTEAELREKGKLKARGITPESLGL